jgi:hypothetical protein
MQERDALIFRQPTPNPKGFAVFERILTTFTGDSTLTAQGLGAVVPHHGGAATFSIRREKDVRVFVTASGTHLP